MVHPPLKGQIPPKKAFNSPPAPPILPTYALRPTEVFVNNVDDSSQSPFQVESFTLANRTWTLRPELEMPKANAQGGAAVVDNVLHVVAAGKVWALDYAGRRWDLVATLAAGEKDSFSLVAYNV